MGVIDNLGFIEEATHYGCAQAGGALVIQAAGAAAWPVLLQAATFSCLDILKMRAGVSPWHARGLRALIKGAIPAEQADVGAGVFKFLLPVEKALFFWFVVDLTTEFQARWMSQIFKLGGCEVSPSECEQWGNDPSWLGLGNDNYSPVLWSNVQRSGVCTWVLRTSFIANLGENWSCTFSVKPRPLLPGNAITNVETRIVKTSPVHFEYDPVKHEPNWFGMEFIAMHHQQGQNKFHGFEVYELQARSNTPCAAVGGSVNVMVSNGPIFNKGIAPVNCFGLSPGGDHGL